MTADAPSRVEVRVPSMLRAATAGEKIVQANGGNIGQVLEDISRRFPAFSDTILDGSGQLRQFVNVYLNDEDIRYLGEIGRASCRERV